MSHATYPVWTVLPFFVLVLAIASLPIALPNRWEHHRFQALVVGLVAAPVILFLLTHGLGHTLGEVSMSYVSFVTTLAALFVTAGGIHVAGDIEATPRTNALFLLLGGVLASVIGTTGASMLLVRPFLQTNRQRRNRAHLVPFFILVVANAGGILTPLGDPPLLVGYLQGVPFFWTLRLWPVWGLYVGTAVGTAYLVDRRAYGREPAVALSEDRRQIEPLHVSGRVNTLLLAAVIGAVFMPTGMRELCMVAITAASLIVTPKAVHQRNGFSMAPIIDVAIIFAGLFACLPPIETMLARAAPHLPLQRSWQLFWGSGLLSAVLDNAPTYAAFTALGRGLSQGQSGLVAGISPLMLAAVSAGSVIMGATTYIGNGPNLMIKAIADRAKFPTPSFARYALFAFTMMVPGHLLMTAAFYFLGQ